MANVLVESSFQKATGHFVNLLCRHTVANVHFIGADADHGA